MTPSGRSRTAASLAQVWMLQDQTSLQLVATLGGVNFNSQQSVEQSWNQLVQTNKDAMSLSGSGTPSELCHPAFGSASWTVTTNAALRVADFLPLTGKARTHRAGISQSVDGSSKRTFFDSRLLPNDLLITNN